jgi:hypothetical protein
VEAERTAANRRPRDQGCDGAMSDDQLHQIDAYYRFFELSLDSWNLFESVNLRKSKIVLASDLNPVIDFFNASEVGIGGRTAKQAATELNLDPGDERKLGALLRLRSYDVYTLRAALGELLPPEHFAKLSLPDEEKGKLEEYTREYTRALFKLIFEDTGAEASDRDSMRQMLEGSAREVVQRNVQTLAKKFNIKPDELVNYIAGVGEMLLAIAFYRRCFEENRPTMQSFMLDMKGLWENNIMCMRHLNLRQNTHSMLNFGARTIKALDEYFKSFDNIGQIWIDITPERFRALREKIERQYPTIGAILCIWQVKINAWNQRFYRRKRKSADNSPEQFAVFFQERIFPDFDKIGKYLDEVKNFDTNLTR